MTIKINSDRPEISIAGFVKDSPAELRLEVLAGENGLEHKRLDSERIQKLGPALAGFTRYIHVGRMQIIGQSEISYLENLSREKKLESLRQLDYQKITCILITKNLSPPPELIEIANIEKLPILRTPLVSSKTINLVTGFLQEKLAPQLTLHGDFLEIYGIGVLIIGESGIGKSECALDLITRGHSLVSDDSVCVKKIGNRLEGSSPEIIFEHIEIRGLGILNIRDLFGVSSIKKCKSVRLCIELKKWDEVEEIERIGLEMRQEKIFDIEVPKVVLPVSSGRNLSTLVETAVRVYLLRVSGYNAAQKLIEKHTAKLGESR